MKFMLGKRLLATYLITLAALLLTACNANSKDVPLDISSAIYEGLIAANRGPVWEPTFELATISRGDLVRTQELNVITRFTVTRELMFLRYGGLYSGAYAELGQRVLAGDLLGVQTFDEDEATRLSRDRWALQLEFIDDMFAEENAARQREIRETRNAGATREATMLEHQRQLWIMQMNDQRMMPQALFERYDDAIKGEHLYAPFDGILTRVSMSGEGTVVPFRHSYFTLADESHVSFVIRSTAADEHGMGAFQLVTPDVIRPNTVHRVTGEYGLEFDLLAISHQPAGAGMPYDHPIHLMTGIVDTVLAPVDLEGLLTSLCERDMTIADLVGMELTITATETLVHNAILVPLMAIRVEDRSEYVLIYNQGNISRRFITRGVQHQQYVQVIIGVEEGQEVVLRD